MVSVFIMADLVRDAVGTEISEYISALVGFEPPTSQLSRNELTTILLHTEKSSSCTTCVYYNTLLFNYMLSLYVTNLILYIYNIMIIMFIIYSNNIEL